MPTQSLQRLLVCLLSLTVLPPLAQALAGGEEVAVVYSKRIPASKEVALYYAEKRGVPAGNLIELEVDAYTDVSREYFHTKIELPIQRALADRELMVFASELVPVSVGRPGGVKYRCLTSKIRYLVMCWGLPIRINHDPKLVEDIVKGMPDAMKRNEACVDSDLALLPVLGTFRYTGALDNRAAYRATEVGRLHPTNSILMVTRLDGPTPAIAKGLVDKAIQAERDGLWGRAYFDLRSVKDPGYAVGDLWLTNAYQAARGVGFECVIDTKPEVLPISFPLSQVAFYAGWYADNNTGPFARPTVEFVPGAVAYHIHSFSASNVRGTNGAWVGPLLARGATVAMGSVFEPYLHLTPDVGIFTERLLVGGWTLGEAAYAATAGLSWQTLIVGDPLYRPGAKSTIQWAAELEASGSTNLDWALLRKLNFDLANGKDPVTAREYLLQLPASARSSVLQEKIGDLFMAKSKSAEALRHWENALALPNTPQQRLRLLRQSADLQAASRQKAQAFDKYELILKDYPDQRLEYDLRRKQLELARDLKRNAEIDFLKAEIARHAPPGK